jgi:large subunit ribosomal protein L23
MKSILIKPVVSEKSNRLSDKLNQYCFVVAKSANKIEIAKAITVMYGVTPVSVNTLIVPGKNKSRSTRRGVTRGIRPSYKKAYVTLAEGDTIDFYNIEEEIPADMEEMNA